MLGVAGKYCSGKSALVSFLQELGFREIDVDSVGHELLREEPVKGRVVVRFGNFVLNANGEIDRRELGRRVFRNRRALRDLERLLHPPMVRRVEQLLQNCSGRVVINAAILFRMGLDRLCSLVIYVRSPLLQRLRRAVSRDGLTLWQALSRTAAQRGICPKYSPEGVDIYYVDNDKGLEALRRQTLKILREKGLEI